MTKIERSIIIERPLAEVFAFTHDPSNDALWQTTLVESQALPEGPMRVGTKVQETRRFLGKKVEMTREITEYAPPKRSSFETASGPVPMSGEYTLEPAEGATKLTATGELDAHGFFKLAEPVFARMAARELESSLAHLKDLLEAADAADRMSDESVLRGAVRS